MKTMFLFSAFLISTTLWASQPETEVRVRQLDADNYEATMTTSKTTDVAAAQNALIPGAEQLCGERKPQFGHYSFETTEPLKKTVGSPSQTLILKQKIKCVTVSDVASQDKSPVATKWEQTKEQAEDIQRLTYEYFTNRDTGNYQQAYALFAESLKAGISEHNWLDSVKQFNAKAGKPLKRQVSKLTWYNKPPISATPGIFAAADYISQFENVDIHCGFVIWKQQQDGSFQIVREEENFIDKATQSTMTDIDIASIKAKYGCVTR